MKRHPGRNELVMSPMVLVWAIGEMIPTGMGNCEDDAMIRKSRGNRNNWFNFELVKFENRI